MLATRLRPWHGPGLLVEKAAGGGMEAARGAVAGVVLAGGLSARMGREKALLHVHGPDQPHLLARTHALLVGLVRPCWVSCRPGRGYPGFHCLYDAKLGLGPAAGVMAALEQAIRQGCTAVLALSCDLPFMDAATLTALLRARAEAPPDILLTLYAAADSGREEPLAAVYEAGALPFLADALGRGERRLGRMIPANLRRVLSYRPEEALPFFNMNRPQDLARAISLAKSLVAGKK